MEVELDEDLGALHVRQHPIDRRSRRVDARAEYDVLYSEYTIDESE
jgi:hypothetical protein